MKHRLNIVKYSKLFVWLMFLALLGLMSRPLNTQAALSNITNTGNSSQITPGSVKEDYKELSPINDTNQITPDSFEEGHDDRPPVVPPPASVSPMVSSDAIAIRVFNNDSYLSPYEWYNRNVGAKRSLQSLIVDGYDAVRDDRTIYVAASNVISPDSRLQPIIVIISFNQNISSETLDILGQILNNWHFNQNIKDFDGTCWTKPGAVTGVNCLNTKDCPSGQYCNSFKAKVVRDTRRLIDLASIKAKLEQYRTTYNHYPSLEAGTYLTNKTLSVWPSWQKVLAIKLNSPLPVDPINKLGECPAGYNPETCWNEQQRNFATTWPDLPDGSRSYQYEYINSTKYTLCANFESSCSNLNNLSCSGTTVNHGPVIECPLLRGLARKPFTRYVAIYDNEGDAINPQITVTPTALADWQPLSVELVNNRQQIKISSAETGYSGRYAITITAKDSQGAVTNQQCSIVIGNGLCGNDQLDSGEDCDALEDIATGPEDSGPDRQYACGDKCQFLGGWCGDGQIESEYDENCDCGNNLKYCRWAKVGENQNQSSATNQYECQNCMQTGGYCGDGQKNEVEPCELGFIYTSPSRASSSYTAQYECNANTCTTRGGWCGDGVVQSNFNEVCEASTWSSPATNNSSESYQYGCDASTCLANTGGWCGDGVVQSNFHEVCEASTWQIPAPENTSLTYQYGCGVDTCTTFGGYCGDGSIQDDFDEVCEATIWQTPTPESTTSTYQYSCGVDTCQADTGGWCGDGIIQNNYGETCDFNESFEDFQTRMNDSNIDHDYYNAFQSTCQNQHCNIMCFDLDNDGYGISGYNTGCTAAATDCDDRPAGADGLFNNADDGKNINPGQPDNCSQYDGVDNNCDGSPDNRASLGGVVWSANFDNNSLNLANNFGSTYATTALDEGSVKLSQNYNANCPQWPNGCTNFNCNNSQNCSCSANQSLTGLTWDLTDFTHATTAPNTLWLEYNGNYVVTFQYKGSANFLHPTTTVVVSGQTTTPVNQITWALRKSNDTNISPNYFKATSTNLIQPTTYSDFNNYLGHFTYTTSSNSYFSIFVGRNNINPNGASINIDNVAINACYNHYPCPDDPSKDCWCGDGKTDSTEECDLKDTYYSTPYPTSTNSTKQYGCSPITCKHNLGGYCGDNIVQSGYGELCDSPHTAVNKPNNSINNQYLCYINSSSLRCVSSTGGYCGDGTVQYGGLGLFIPQFDNEPNDLYYYPYEICDYASNPQYSKTPKDSDNTHQYECHTSTACTTTGGYCGDNYVQSLHGESDDCGSSRCCFKNNDDGTRRRVLYCTTTNSRCGDHIQDYYSLSYDPTIVGYHYYSCFEECDYEPTYHPLPGNTNQSVQYECTPASTTLNAPGECLDTGGWCGDGIVQDWYGEQCDYNVTSTLAVTWTTSTQYCDDICEIENIPTPHPLQWVEVPGNSDIGTSNFQVMKYPAYVLGHLNKGGSSHEQIVCNTSTYNCVLTSLSCCYPKMAIVTLPMAKDMCNAIGAHLITNEEWMTIVRNVENVGVNWTSGTVGQGKLKFNEPNFTLSNGETIFSLSNDYVEFIDSYIVPSEGEWPTLPTSTAMCNTTTFPNLPYNNFIADCKSYNNYPTTFRWYPYDAIVDWGTLDPDKFRPNPDYDIMSSTSSIDLGYGGIYLRKTAPIGPYYLIRNGFNNYPGLLRLHFNNSEGFTTGFRCVKNSTP